MAFRHKDEKQCTGNFMQRHTITKMPTQTLPMEIMGFGWDITGQFRASGTFHQIELFDENNQSWTTVISKLYFH